MDTYTLLTAQMDNLLFLVVASVYFERLLLFLVSYPYILLHIRTCQLDYATVNY